MLSEAELKYPSCSYRNINKKARRGEFRQFHGLVWRRESHGFGEQETISHALYNLWFVIFTNASNLCSFFCIHHNLKQTLSVTDFILFIEILVLNRLATLCGSTCSTSVCTMFCGTVMFPVLYLLNEALLGFGISCASWQRERKWKNVTVSLSQRDSIDEEREKRGTCAFRDGDLQHPVLNAVLTNNTVLAPRYCNTVIWIWNNHKRGGNRIKDRLQVRLKPASFG